MKYVKAHMTNSQTKVMISSVIDSCLDQHSSVTRKNKQKT